MVAVPGVNSRRRFLSVMEILQEKTDEDHGISLSELTRELKVKFGTSFEVTDPVLREDIKSLQDHGFWIGEEKAIGYPTRYKWMDRRFGLHEVRLLIDAVASAHCLTVQDSEQLITKLKLLVSQHQAKRLSNRLFVEEHVKTNMGFVKHYIRDIHEAILNRKRITFQYRKFDINKRLVFHRDGFHYVVSPYALVWNQDNYYLIAKQDGFDGVKTFRVDRLYAVTELNESFVEPNFNVAQHVKKTFHMYPGPVNQIRVQFDNSLLNVVMDRFGEKAALRVADDKSFIVVFPAAVSEGLFRWLLTWGADAKVLSPPELAERLRCEAQKMVQSYTLPGQ
ncbi:YafY family protein [Alicyclobacillus sp. SO9]|uniref:helix-turn-helix transcriptional regulator n=1 Tax=Alicyclobacillus sp. SO9 TaxID=2665646 RepID=UPI0018E8FB83|nr:WYL domain-containing protein [Alicyclobacillus sp. SO9]QQE80449.1 WYL domain-containing protein [Alicyclobacillus sp. SO9]